MINDITPVTLAMYLALLSLVPIIVVMTTSFLKISIVILLVRNALGVQQIPPNIAIYSITIVLTCYVMAPVAHTMYATVSESPEAMKSIPAFIESTIAAAGPLREFLSHHSDPDQVTFFANTVKRIWPAELAATVTGNDFSVLLPAFLVTELSRAFMVGFLLYLPFVVIDLIVQSVMLALGMMMMSPMTISLPLKLLLFVMADGWSRLLHGLVVSYAS
ncbi:type III secretion system protein SsaR [Pandoraea commovens]|uniref:Type III secretion system protein SsaR n=1 Tax=Pandoraea commovens TaxID=2508289 RepID=A0A5E4W901_9BURK|nr:type III secretion system protein SsaR [Pandoraea commovens]